MPLRRVNFCQVPPAARQSICPSFRNRPVVTRGPVYSPESWRGRCVTRTPVTPSYPYSFYPRVYEPSFYPNHCHTAYQPSVICQQIENPAITLAAAGLLLFSTFI